uniref:Uncharacterized protein n=1 Tax=Paramormyrops kingsleyae TaxID=1676925 RepID=A0A3B3TAK5_9TELE
MSPQHQNNTFLSHCGDTWSPQCNIYTSPLPHTGTIWTCQITLACFWTAEENRRTQIKHHRDTGITCKLHTCRAESETEYLISLCHTLI